MNVVKRTVAVAAAIMTVATAASCGKKKNAATTAAASTVADLALSSTLKLSIPDKLATASGGTASTTLDLAEELNLVGKKSSEACRTMETVKQVLDNLKEIGSMFCHFEAESENLKFGTKYNIKMSGKPGLAGSTTMGIWVDNSDAANIKVYMCKDGKLNQQISVSDFASAGKAKGSMNTMHTGTQGSATFEGGINITFDLTQAGLKIINANMKHKNTGGEYAGEFRNSADISLSETGVSVVKMTSKGARGSDTMSDQAAVRFNGTMGQALFSGTGSNGGRTYDYSSLSTFGADGVTVAKSTATSDILVLAADLPSKLADDFTPTAPTGWDCTTTEDLKIDMADAAKKASHDACEQDHSRTFTSCWGDGFEQGDHEAKK
jgi:hypothetical protein